MRRPLRLYLYLCDIILLINVDFCRTEYSLKSSSLVFGLQLRKLSLKWNAFQECYTVQDCRL